MAIGLRCIILNLRPDLIELKYILYKHTFLRWTSEDIQPKLSIKFIYFIIFLYYSESTINLDIWELHGILQY